MCSAAVIAIADDYLSVTVQALLSKQPSEAPYMVVGTATGDIPLPLVRTACANIYQSCLILRALIARGRRIDSWFRLR